MQKLIFLIFALIPFGEVFAQDMLNEEPPPTSETNDVFIAILGDSASENDEKAFNEEVLSSLFKLIRQKNPNAVFFTGNPTLGMTKQNAIAVSGQRNLIVEAPSTDIYGNNWAKKKYVYSSIGYEKQLDSFISFEKQKLGMKIPFYPMMGNFDALGPDSIDIFKDKFNLSSSLVIDFNQLVYTVAIADACFFVIATDRFDIQQNKLVENELTIPILDWLENELKNKSQRYRFLFVLGHQPAFSTTASSGTYSGIDKDTRQRDRFWKLLKDYHVLAYFCSHEHLYDRSYRDGVWQIISGGAGAPLNKRDLLKAFYHFLLLSYPSDPDQESIPLVQVIDGTGKVRDKFELKNQSSAIYQLRISSSQ